MKDSPPVVFSALRARSIAPVIKLLPALGINVDDALLGTGLTADRLNAEGLERLRITLQQEFIFYDNIRSLSGIPSVGLQLGQSYPVTALGDLGKALTCAQTIGDAIRIAVRFSPLTLSFFRPVMVRRHGYGGIALEKQYDIPLQLLQLFSDKAVTAAITTLTSFLNIKLPIRLIRLMHQGEGGKSVYVQALGCEIQFGHYRNEILVEEDLLDVSSSMGNAQKLKQCLDACRFALANYRSNLDLSQRVRDMIVAQPGHFPCAAEIAELLACTTRTLRRKLSSEGEHYQSLLNETRSELAKEYLKSDLSVDAISEILGFSEAATFSKAFKGWTSLSPADYRNRYLR